MAIIAFVLTTSIIFYMQEQNAIQEYQANIEEMTEEEINSLQSNINNYNSSTENLNIEEESLIGYINIPSISCYLPIYNNTKEATLLKGACKLESSGIPSTESSYHTVIVGHSGYTGKTLFTNLSKVKYDDLFYITILDETFEYKVNEIKKVLPDDVESIKVKMGDQKVTLVTCTPIYINTYRLLVTGTFTRKTKVKFKYI